MGREEMYVYIYNCIGLYYNIIFIYKTVQQILDNVTTGLVSLCCCRLLERQQLFLYTWNPFIADTIGTNNFVLYSEVS